jgi:hypothetical protein
MLRQILPLKWLFQVQPKVMPLQEQLSHANLQPQGTPYNLNKIIIAQLNLR